MRDLTIKAGGSWSAAFDLMSVNPYKKSLTGKGQKDDGGNSTGGPYVRLCVSFPKAACRTVRGSHSDPSGRCLQVTRSTALGAGQPASAMAMGKARRLTVTLAGWANHLPGSFALLAGNFPCTPALFTTHHEASLAGSIAIGTFNQPQGLATGTVDATVTFAPFAEAVTQRAETFTDIAYDWGFHSCGLLLIPRAYHFHGDEYRSISPAYTSDYYKII